MEMAEDRNDVLIRCRIWYNNNIH